MAPPVVCLVAALQSRRPMKTPTRPIPSPDRVQWRRRMAMLLWRALAVLSLALAVAGTVLPVLPTVPFVLLAAWAAGKGWPRLEQWLLAHPLFGAHIRRWRERGVVPRRAKWLATLMMGTSATGLQFMPLPLWLRLGVPAVMLAVAIWLWRRPDA